jgi:hypothetical protein
MTDRETDQLMNEAINKLAKQRMANHSELDLCWWQKAALAKVQQKAAAIFNAYCTLADLRNRSVSDSEMLAAALRETINQCQDGQGMISAPELLRIATELDVAEDDIDLFQAQ